MKKCSKCNIEKSLNNFSKDAKSKDNLQSQCKDCKARWIRENDCPSKHIKRKKSKKASLRWYNNNKVRQNVARMIRTALNGHAKSKPTFDALGYTVEELKEYLESQFQDGMTWENYGQWHIDHIIPQSKLKYTSVEDENFKKCWALTNLQPLWAIDNCKKGNRLFNSEDSKS